MSQPSKRSTSSRRTSRVLQAVLLLQSAAWAQGAPEPAADPEPSAAPRSEAELESEVRNRLLHLAQGVVLRGPSRRVDGCWELGRDGHWTRLPQDAVVASRLEHRVLRELGERREALPASPTATDQLQLATWCLDEGLYAEGLGELDRLLVQDPDHVGALLLLARPQLPFGLPAYALERDGWPAGLVSYGGSAPRALQELVVRELGRAPDDEAVRAHLAASLRSPDPGERAFAALALRRLYPEGVALPELLRRSLVDPYESVRSAAALALRDTGDEGLALPLVRALESSSSVIRTHAARSLGTMGFAAAVEPLAARLMTLRTAAGGDAWRAPSSHIFVGRQIAFVQDFDPEVATNAVIAKPVIGVVQEGVTLDVRVHGISGSGGNEVLAGYSHATETAALRRALARITGAEVRDTNVAWRQWWEDSGAAWMAAHLQPRTATTSAVPAGGG